MELHPSYPALSTLVAKYPKAAGTLFQAYNDVLFAQQWTDVEVLDLAPCKRGAIKGKRPNTDIWLYVVPCSLSESISTGWLSDAFATLSNPPEFYLAITSEDASIVYYKLSSGLVKPSA